MKKKWDKFWDMLAEGYSRDEAESFLELDSAEVDHWFEEIIKFIRTFQPVK